MQHKHLPAFRYPESLPTHTGLSLNARKLAIAMFSICERKTGAVCKSQRYLAQVAGLSPDTVNKAIKELVRAEYVTVQHAKAHYNPVQGCPTRSASVYICALPYTGYKCLPYRLWHKLQDKKLSGAELVVFLCVYQLMRNGRAYPSHAAIAKRTGLSPNYVCTILTKLDITKLLYKQQCKKRDGSFSCNSYFLYDFSTEQPVAASGTTSGQPAPKRVQASPACATACRYAFRGKLKSIVFGADVCIIRRMIPVGRSRCSVAPLCISYIDSAQPP